jgi:hypothetical protein
LASSRSNRKPGGSRPRKARKVERAATGDVDLDLLALFQFERLDHGGGQANREAIAPFGDAHECLL